MQFLLSGVLGSKVLEGLYRGYYNKSLLPPLFCFAALGQGSWPASALSGERDPL